jgi:cation diffusion facilitator CzcD-associated flavoprotein CzcO
VIIYGTGFQTLHFLGPMSVTGLGGRQLRESWRDGAEAYLGMAVSGFPNFFMLYGPNTNLGGNSILYMLEGQISYALGGQAIDREPDWSTCGLQEAHLSSGRQGAVGVGATAKLVRRRGAHC